MTIKTIRLKKTNILTTQAEREVKAAIIMLALFCAGMIVGAGIIRIQTVNEITDSFVDLFNMFVKNRTTSKTSQLFINYLSINGMILLITFCCGLSCLGMPLIAAIPLIRGIGYGLLSGYLINFYKFTGIGYYVMTIFPGALLTVSALIFSGSVSIVTSFDVLSVFLSKHQADQKKFQNYIKKSSVFLLMILIAAITDTILAKTFSYLFVL